MTLRLINAISILASYVCPLCGWWAESGHVCHPADRRSSRRGAGVRRYRLVEPEGEMIMSETVRVKVLLLFGDQAEIVADAATSERGEPLRYPAAEIAQAVGVPVAELPGKRLLATVGPDDRLSGWRLA